MSLGASVHQSLCMQARFPPPNTSTMYASAATHRAWMACRCHPCKALCQRGVHAPAHKSWPDSIGSTSSCSFLISLSDVRALDHLGFLFDSSLTRWVFLGHLVTNVGGLGTPLAGAGVAVAFQAKSKGGCTVSATVSVYKVGGDDVVATGSSEGQIWQLTVWLGNWVFNWGVGGCTCRSCTGSQTSLMVWGGGLACYSLIRSTTLPTSGDSVPVSMGVKLVQSASSASLGSWSCAW